MQEFSLISLNALLRHGGQRIFRGQLPTSLCSIFETAQTFLERKNAVIPMKEECSYINGTDDSETLRQREALKSR